MRKMKLISLISLIVAGAAVTMGCTVASEEPSDRAVGTKAGVDASSVGILTANALYTCPMHPEVVTADADKECPLCGMDLEAMSESALSSLRNHEIVICPMDPIAVIAMAGDQDCPVCGMDLVPVDKAASSSAGQGDHNGSHGGHGEHSGGDHS